MDSSFLSGFSDSSTRPLLEYSGHGSLVHVEADHAGNSSGQEYDIISTFKSDGFSDFELDLTCLSNPPSPILEATGIASSDHVGALELSPSPLPLIPKRSPSLKSLSFFSSKTDTPSLPNETPSAVDVMKGSSSGVGQLVKYVGRGTPIDPTRRVVWSANTVGSGGGGGGPHLSSDEHGVLFSPNASGGHDRRSHSLDSAAAARTFPFPHHHHSQEWQGIGIGVGVTSSSTHRHHTISGSGSGSGSGTQQPQPQRALSPLLQLSLDTSPLEPLPESSKLCVKGIESDPDEWNSVMDTVMNSSGERIESSTRLLVEPKVMMMMMMKNDSNNNADDPKDVHKSRTTTTTTPPSLPDKRDENGDPGAGARATTSAASNRSSSSNNDFGMFGLDTAVDLGLGLGDGMNFFNLGLAPGSSDVAVGIGEHQRHQRASTMGGGRDSPSVYSTAPPSPEGPSPAGSVRGVGGGDDGDKKGVLKRGLERRVEDVVGGSPGASSGDYLQDRHRHHHYRAQWWKKLFMQLRKLQLVLRANGSR
ncbi:hypothetical protein L218DRAFT_114513 [Marasmius fiardii PR-910]|nr:hypothetical protein L218DRAFT_114513 [Marasmius fiardii PR-910]